jgi:hypothetical protein
MLQPWYLEQVAPYWHCDDLAQLKQKNFPSEPGARSACLNFWSFASGTAARPAVVVSLLQSPGRCPLNPHRKQQDRNLLYSDLESLLPKGLKRRELDDDPGPEPPDEKLEVEGLGRVAMMVRADVSRKDKSWRGFCAASSLC